MESKEINLDIGAGSVEAFLQRARENPDKFFVAIESRPWREWEDLKAHLPPNLSLLATEITTTHDLPFPDNSVDEANLDFVFSFIEGAVEEEPELYNTKLLFPRLIKESLRVLKPGGKLILRDFKDTAQNVIEPVFRDFGLAVSMEPMSPESAKEHSMSTREAFGDFKRGDVGSQPYIVEVSKG